jgi:hypothetical protein
MPVSRNFIGRNSQPSSKRLWNSRLKYDIFAYEPLLGPYSQNRLRPNRNTPRPVVNFQYAENTLYGKIDHKGAPVIMRKKIDKWGTRLKDTKARRYIKYATFINTMALLPHEQGQKPLSAVNFVSYAFRRFVEEFLNRCRCDSVYPKSEYLKNIRVFKAYESPSILHETLRKKIYQGFLVYTQQTNNKRAVNNFEDFMEYFMWYFERVGHGMPLTRSGFVRSRWLTQFHTGLTISISDQNCGHDQTKVDEFIDDPGFSLFLRKAAKHGFSVDKHVPWRLVADLASVPMQEYMRQHGVGNLEIYFDTYTNHAYQADYIFLKRFLVDTYNSYVESNRSYEQHTENQCGYPIAEIISRQYSSDAALASAGYDAKYWLKTYAKIRNIEEYSILDDTELEMLARDIDQMYDVKVRNRTADREYNIDKYIDSKFEYLNHEHGSTASRLMKRKRVDIELEEDGFPLRRTISKKTLTNRYEQRRIPIEVMYPVHVYRKKLGKLHPDSKAHKPTLRQLANTYYRRNNDNYGSDAWLDPFVHMKFRGVPVLKLNFE